MGLFITAAILFVLKDAAREVDRRLMDAVDPALVDTAEQALAGTPGVQRVAALRMRWVGHRLHAETDVVVADTLTLVEVHVIALNAEHRLLHAVPPLTAATIHRFGQRRRTRRRRPPSLMHAAPRDRLGR